MYRFYINGNEYEAKKNWSISEKANSPSSSSFTVLLKEGQPIPKTNDFIEFYNNENVLFRGVCKIPKGTAFKTGCEEKEYSLNCNNYNSILSRRLPNISYENKPLSYVVNKLYEEYIREEGFSMGRVEIDKDPVFDIYNSKEIGLDKLLNELANYADAIWEITPNKVFNFYSAKSVPYRTVILDSTNAGITALSHSMQDNALRTRQIIEGTTIETTPQTEKFTYYPDDKGVSFNVVYPISVRPIIKVNGIAIPEDIIGVRGIDDGSEDKLFMFAYKKENINVNSTYKGELVLNEGDRIEITYIGIVDVRLELDNAGKIEEINRNTGFSGIIENYYFDSTLKTPNDALQKANALLLAHGEEKNSLSAKCTTESLISCGLELADTNIGSLWSFNLPELNIIGDYVITERKLSPCILSDSNSYEITIKWKDRDFADEEAKTLSSLENGLTRLQVRGELKIIKYARTDEKTTLKEQVVWSNLLPQYVGQGMDNGQIAVPLGSLYPYLII